MRSDKRSSYDIWSSQGCDEGERLLAFEKWVAGELAEKIRWPKNEQQMLKQVMQCRAMIMEAVADMGNSGYLFQPKELASMIRENLEDIRKRQDAGQIRDVFPYLKMTWDRYVGARREELKECSMQLGSHVSQAVGNLKTIPDLVAQEHRERLVDKKAKARKKQRTRKPDDLPLFKDLQPDCSD